MTKANNRYAAAQTDGIDDHGHIRIFCAYYMPESMRRTDTPVLIFRCPICGGIHTHGYGEGHRCSHCMDKTFWTKEGCRTDIVDLIKQVNENDDGYVLVPTDDFSKIGNIGKDRKSRLMSIREAEYRYAVVSFLTNKESTIAKELPKFTEIFGVHRDGADELRWRVKDMISYLGGAKSFDTHFAYCINGVRWRLKEISDELEAFAAAHPDLVNEKQ